VGRWGPVGGSGGARINWVIMPSTVFSGCPGEEEEAELHKRKAAFIARVGHISSGHG